MGKTGGEGDGEEVVAEGPPENTYLSWYESLKHTKAHDSLLVSADCIVRPLPTLDKPRSRKFHLELTVPGKRVYLLRANDPQVRDAWVAALDNVVKEAKERIRVANTIDEGTGASPPTTMSPHRPQKEEALPLSPVPYLAPQPPSEAEAFFPPTGPACNQGESELRGGEERQQPPPATPPPYPGDGGQEGQATPWQEVNGGTDDSYGEGVAPALGRFHSPKQHQSPLRYTRQFLGAGDGEHQGSGFYTPLQSCSPQPSLETPNRSTSTAQATWTTPPTSPPPGHQTPTSIAVTRPQPGTPTSIASPRTPSPTSQGTTNLGSPGQQTQQISPGDPLPHTPTRQPAPIPSNDSPRLAEPVASSMGGREDPSYLHTQHAILLAINTQLNIALEERRKRHEEESRDLAATVTSLQEENARLRGGSPMKLRSAQATGMVAAEKEDEDDLRMLLQHEQKEVERLREEGRSLRKAQEASDREVRVEALPHQMVGRFALYHDLLIPPLTRRVLTPVNHRILSPPRVCYAAREDDGAARGRTASTS